MFSAYFSRLTIEFHIEMLLPFVSSQYEWPDVFVGKLYIDIACVGYRQF